MKAVICNRCGMQAEAGSYDTAPAAWYTVYKSGSPSTQHFCSSGCVIVSLTSTPRETAGRPNAPLVAHLAEVAHA